MRVAVGRPFDSLREAATQAWPAIDSLDRKWFSRCGLGEGGQGSGEEKREA